MVVLFLLVVSGARGAVPVGLADQQASALVDPQLGALGLRSARVVAPWDAALGESAALDNWLRTAQGLGLEAFVSFGRRKDEDCRTGPCRLPSANEYRAAFLAFRARWPWVTTFGAWNEANHPGQPTANAPTATAGLYETVVAACPECRIVAPEVLDIDSMLGWLRRFRAALRTEPPLWGLHNYGDVTYGRATSTEALLAAVPGKVWVTETGGIVQADRWPYDEGRARLGVLRALALADAHPDQIERVFMYQWRAAWWEAWDAGLLRPDGTPRPGYAALADYVGVPAPPVKERLPDGTEIPVRELPLWEDGSGPVPGPGPRGDDDVPKPGAPGAATVVRRPRVSRAGLATVRVACPARATRPCTTRLSLRTRVHRGRRVALGKTTSRIRPGRAATLSVRLPVARRRLIRRGHTTSIVARVESGWRRDFVVRCPR